MSNKKVIVEIMFGDFLTLAFDQIINHISKFIWVYNNIKLPIIIRTPMGEEEVMVLRTHNRSRNIFVESAVLRFYVLISFLI